MIFTFMKKVKEKITVVTKVTDIVVSLPVKAAGVLCVLGISFGIGTYVLYKIYDKYFRPKGKGKQSRPDHTDHILEDDFCHETDEGTMGNQQSSYADIPVYYKKGYGVSLYDPSDREQACLRYRKSGVHITELDNQSDLREILEKDVKHTNGMVAITAGNLRKNKVHDAMKGEGQPTQGQGQRPDIATLKIDIDESGYVEDERIETNSDKISILGNFSPTSLQEKNSKYGLRSSSDLETEGEQSEGDQKNVNNNGNEGNIDRLKVVPNLQTSSVLLTPPSEDDMSTSSSQPVTSPSTHQSTKSDVSDIHSEIAEPYTVEALETDDEREKMSPLPLDRSPRRTPEKVFRKKLILKLNEITSRTHGLKSNTSSTCSSPDSRSRHNSLSADIENSISGVSSPELELLPSESTENQAEVPKTFFQLEEEIHCVEDEFETISKKIEELTSKYSTQTDDQGSQIIDTIFERYPSIRVRQTERGVHFDPMSSLSENDSHESKYTSDTEDKSGTDNDLSWDLENLLDMVYSEGSESAPMQHPKVKQLVMSDKNEQSDRSASESQDSVFGNSTINSSVEMDGTLFEDAFHLKLGTAAFPTLNEEQHEDDEVFDVNIQPQPAVCNIGERQSIQEYAEREWRGETQNAEKMKKAYAEIPTQCHCCYLRRIRGDNYCGIRGTVFQTFVNNIPPRLRWASKEQALQCLSDMFCDRNSGLGLWTFANRLEYTGENKLEVMSRCVSSVFDKFTDLNQHSEQTEREQVVERFLNSDPKSDLELMEGVKLLMFLTAASLHGDMQQGNDVPVFVWLMFARDTSEDIASFVKNHLNSIGDTGGLEQVEMFLLGYTLGVRIKVFRLSQYGEADFVSYYPDDCSTDWPTVSLIAEDDRHYNVPVL